MLEKFMFRTKVSKSIPKSERRKCLNDIILHFSEKNMKVDVGKIERQLGLVPDPERLTHPVPRQFPIPVKEDREENAHSRPKRKRDEGLALGGTARPSDVHCPIFRPWQFPVRSQSEEKHTPSSSVNTSFDSTVIICL